MSSFYPVYLDLRGRLCVVIGGGAVAEEKVEGLLAAGARVRLIAPQPNEALQRLADRGAIDWRARPYREGDLAGAFLALAERLGAPTHRALRDEAEHRNVPLNVQDEIDYCSFYAAALFRRGDLTLAISTAGKAPALAARLRQRFENMFGEHYAHFLDLAGRLRQPLKERFPDFATRRDLWYRLVDSDVLELLEQGDEAGAIERMAGIMGVRPTGTEHTAPQSTVPDSTAPESTSAESHTNRNLVEAA
ncbi:MAG: bifunctional precorrin-2 dehydrogenase/sirohydrochlorin ferrochelatase [Acidobacteriota bacterium]